MHNIEDFPLPCDQSQPLPGSSQQPSFFFAGLSEPWVARAPWQLPVLNQGGQIMHTTLLRHPLRIFRPSYGPASFFLCSFCFYPSPPLLLLHILIHTSIHIQLEHKVQLPFPSSPSPASAGCAVCWLTAACPAARLSSLPDPLPAVRRRLLPLSI